MWPKCLCHTSQFWACSADIICISLKIFCLVMPLNVNLYRFCVILTPITMISLVLLYNVSLPSCPWYIHLLVSHLPNTNKLYLLVGTYNMFCSFKLVMLSLYCAHRITVLCPSACVCLSLTPFIMCDVRINVW